MATVKQYTIVIDRADDVDASVGNDVVKPQDLILVENVLNDSLPEGFTAILLG